MFPWTLKNGVWKARSLHQEVQRWTQVIASCRLASRQHTEAEGGDMLAGWANRGKGHRGTQPKTIERWKLSRGDPHKCSTQMARRSICTLPLPANYILCLTSHFLLAPMPTLLKRWICSTWNNTSPFFTPSNLWHHAVQWGSLFMDWQFNAWKREMKWEEKSKENCLSCPSPPCTLLICLW